MKYPMCICTDMNSKYEAFLPDFLEYDISCNHINTLREVKKIFKKNLITCSRIKKSPKTFFYRRN